MLYFTHPQQANMKFMRIFDKIRISENLLQEIKNKFNLRLIKSKTHLFYQGQVPIAGFFLLKGNVEIYKNKKNKTIIPEGTFFGVSECLNRKPVTVNAEVLPDSEIFLLDQSTLKEILANDSNNELKEKFHKFLDVGIDQNG